MSFSASTRFSFRVALARLRHSSKWKNSPVLPPPSPLLGVMRFVHHRDKNHPLSCSRMLLLLSYWNFPTLFCLGVIFKVLLRLLFALFVMARYIFWSASQGGARPLFVRPLQTECQGILFLFILSLANFSCAVQTVNFSALDRLGSLQGLLLIKSQRTTTKAHKQIKRGARPLRLTACMMCI